MLAGLEHLDDRYLHAINYAPKSGRGIYPKMVIVGDIIGNDDATISKYVEEVKKIAIAATVIPLWRRRLKLDINTGPNAPRPRRSQSIPTLSN